MTGIILIVDDSPDNLRVLEDILVADGHRVRAAVNGEVALRAVAACLPDLILLDIMMPGMDGFEVCRRLKEDPSTSSIPVLFISALAYTEDKIKAFDAGGLDYITKPFAEKEVLARIRTHLKLAAAQEDMHRVNRKLVEEIQARMRVEKALKESEEEISRINAYNRSLIEASLDPLVTIGPNGLITDANAATEEVTGRKRGELIGSDFSDFFTDPDSARSGYQKVFRDGLVRDYPLEIRHRDGRITPVLYNASVFRNIDGEVIGVFAAARDITEQKQAEESRKKLETQLQHAQKMEAIGLLAGGIAHDFNNILTAIIGYSEVIAESMDIDSLLRHSVEQIHTSAERGAALTKSLLAFSRKQILQMIPLNLCDVVRGIKKMLQRLVPEDIEFRTMVPDMDLLVIADKGQLELVLVNLVTNANDAMPMGGNLTIEVSHAFLDDNFVNAHGFDNPGDYACISVTDTGHGMNEETRKRAFEPFFTTKEIGKGTGLGMSIIYGIIQQHNGHILVSSEPGRGTNIRIYLSLIAGDGKKALDVHGTRPAVGGTETVLLVEDDATIQLLNKGILEKAGYTVITAVDGQDALDKFLLHGAEVDILITDVVMPKMNGKKLFEEIRKTRPDMKALFISGYPMDVLNEKGIMDNGLNFMNKPLKAYELLIKVRDILDRP